MDKERLNRLQQELEKARKKRDDWDGRVKELERKYREAENTFIHDMVHAASLTPEQLAELIKRASVSLPRTEEAGEQGRGGDDDAHVGGHGVGERRVFQQEIQRDAGETRRGEQRALAPVLQPQAHGAQQKQRQHPDGKAQHDELHRGEGAQQHLGGDERAAPDEDAKESGQVTAKRRIHGDLQR